MSHLPEVEVLRKDLEKEVVGKRVKDVSVKTAKIVGRHRHRPDFIAALDGRKIEGVRRHGTWLLFDLDDRATLCAHLGDQAVMTRETATAESGPHTQVVVTFTTGGALHLVDPGKTSRLFVAPTEGVEHLEELVPGGIDPLSGAFTWHAFARYLAGRHAALKSLLVDETFILGLGDLYADEILWSAGLAPDRRSDALSSQEVRRLYRALFEVLYEAIKQGGTADLEAEGEHTDLFGEPGDYGSHLNVHGRAGEPCPRCRRPVVHTEVEGVGAYHCSSCQG